MTIIILVIFILTICILRVCQLLFNLRYLQRDFFLKMFYYWWCLWFQLNWFKSHNGHRGSRALRAGVRSIRTHVISGRVLYSQQVLKKFRQWSGSGFSSCFFLAMGLLGLPVQTQDLWGPKAKSGGRKTWDLSFSSAETGFKVPGFSRSNIPPNLYSSDICSIVFNGGTRKMIFSNKNTIY